ncbi:MAG: dephospho-CoA kinase [Thermodesulfovibrionales bacterium]|nr:dephospho-CoA kinase [Thermodesulfovibrionales bacterium]
MKLIGLTGNIGMGKSTAGKYFSQLGALVIDTDNIVRELFNNKEVQDSLVRLFGDHIISQGIVNKNAISDVVFKSEDKRQALEDLLHPLVFEKLNEIITENKDREMIIVEAPIIFERGYEDKFDYVINVFCSNDLAIDRLVKKGYTRQQAQQRLSTQMPYNKKNELADFTIDNNSNEGHLKDEVKKIFLQLERITDDSNRRNKRVNKD